MAKKGNAKALSRLQRIHDVLSRGDMHDALELLDKWISKESRLLGCDKCGELCTEPDDLNAWVWSERPGEGNIMRPLHQKCQSSFPHSTSATTAAYCTAI